VIECTFELPTMYADHHVTRVREVLLERPGVSEVVASAAARQVRVRCDESVVSEQELAAALASAGYEPGVEPASLTFAQPHQDGSTWYVVTDRTTKTERKDREMAGDFRRY
jgi:copper chaperone CopZ